MPVNMKELTCYWFRYVKGAAVNWPAKGCFIQRIRRHIRLFLDACNGPYEAFVCYRKEVLETINLDEIRFGYAFQ
jgi:dolichol-phosphate mannosyltransferase